MSIEDEEVRPGAGLVGKPALERLGIAELERYVAALRDEIGRAEGEIARKAGVRLAAEGFFRTP